MIKYFYAGGLALTILGTCINIFTGSKCEAYTVRDGSVLVATGIVVIGTSMFGSGFKYINEGMGNLE